MPEKIGIMGGTFDPIHIGHLRVAEEAVEMLRLDALTFVPAAMPPHKLDRNTLSFEHRWRMLSLAVEGRSIFHLSDVENRLPGKSYTVVTLRKMRKELPPGSALFFLVGLDAFLELDTWWRFEELFKLASMVVLRRPGYHGEDLGRFLKETISPLYSYDSELACFKHPELLPVYYLKNTRLGVSSTRIRRLVAERRSIRYLVPDNVLRYIEENGLYRAEAAVACGGLDDRS